MTPAEKRNSQIIRRFLGSAKCSGITLHFTDGEITFGSRDLDCIKRIVKIISDEIYIKSKA